MPVITQSRTLLSYTRNGVPSLVLPLEHPSDLWHLMRARYYDPYAGRFISKDPIGYNGGLNLYDYVNGNPANYIDPSGYDYMSLYGQHTPYPHVDVDEWSPPECFINDFWGCFGKCIGDNDPLGPIPESTLLLTGGAIPKIIPKLLGLRVIVPPGASQFTTLPSILSLITNAGSRSWLRILGRLSFPLALVYGFYMASVEAYCASICAGYVSK